MIWWQNTYSCSLRFEFSEPLMGAKISAARTCFPIRINSNYIASFCNSLGLRLNNFSDLADIPIGFYIWFAF